MSASEEPLPLYQLARLRSRAYDFLSSLYLEPPSEALLSALLSSEFRAALAAMAEAAGGAVPEVAKGTALIRDCMDELRERPAEEALTSLSSAFTSLFRGLKPQRSPPPPYESVYTEGRVMGVAVSDVTRTYASAGLEVKSSEAADHLGIELAFMAYLCSKEAEARLSGDDEGAARLALEELRFLERHLLNWVPRFCEVAEPYCRRAGLGGKFYSGVLLLTKGFLKLDSKILQALT